jgi:hypothetical protein
VLNGCGLNVFIVCLLVDCFAQAGIQQITTGLGVKTGAGRGRGKGTATPAWMAQVGQGTEKERVGIHYTVSFAHILRLALPPTSSLLSRQLSLSCSLVLYLLPPLAPLTPLAPPLTPPLFRHQQQQKDAIAAMSNVPAADGHAASSEAPPPPPPWAMDADAEPASAEAAAPPPPPAADEGSGLGGTASTADSDLQGFLDGL